MILNINSDMLKKLTATEKVVVDYINKNEKFLANKSIVEIAEESFTSKATVSRTIKKCGLNGFSELRYKLLSKVDYEDNHRRVGEILGKSLIEVSKTIDNIAINDILDVVDNIRKSRRIYILSRGLTMLVADEFNLKLQILGFNTFNISDPDIMMKICKRLTTEDVVISFSLNGKTAEIVKSCMSAKECDSKVIVVSCVEKSILNDIADVKLIGFKKQGDLNKEYDITSRLPLFVISRVMFDYLTFSN